MPVGGRQLILGFVVSAFVLQTWLIYSDDAGRTTPPLSELAVRGREIWHERNCQSCHQIYGFGGFLGPDLTNAAERLTDARLETVLTVGAGQMPGFGLGPEDRAAIARFLEEVHATGRGQLAPLSSFDAQEVLAEAAATDGPLGEPELRGLAVTAAQKCIGCHLPNPLATKRSTDLTALVPKLGRDGVKGIVLAGIPSKGMPGFDLDAADLDALLAFLERIAANGDAVRQAFIEAAPSKDDSAGLPWFEYE